MVNNINQAIHNLHFLILLGEKFPGQFTDWKITVIFYIGVHYADAYFSSRNIVIKNHNQRNFELQHGDCSVSSAVCYAYLDLYLASRYARYNGFKNEKLHFIYLKNVYSDCKKLLHLVRDYIISDLVQDDNFDKIQKAESEAYTNFIK